MGEPMTPDAAMVRLRQYEQRPAPTWSCTSYGGSAAESSLAGIARVLADEVGRLRGELGAVRADLLDIRGVLSPNGGPSRVPMPLGASVAPAVEWLADEVERLRGERAPRTASTAEVSAVKVTRRADGRWRVRYKRDGRRMTRPFDTREQADQFAADLRTEARKQQKNGGTR